MIARAINPDGLDIRHGQAELLEVRLNIGIAVPTAEFDDGDTLAAAV